MKSSEEIEEWFDEIYDDTIDPVSDNEIIQISDANYERPKIELNENQIEQLKTQGIIEFYTCTGLWKLYWRTKPESNINTEGTFEFIPFEQMISSTWDDDLGGNDWAPDMKGFRPIDMFYDMDGFVGFFIGREDKKGLYLVHSDSSVSPLHVNFEGYLKLLGMSKGFGWWQNALVEISTGEHQPNVDDFKEKMPQIFPDFNFDEFKALYESLRIDK